MWKYLVAIIFNLFLVTNIYAADPIVYIVDTSVEHYYSTYFGNYDEVHVWFDYDTGHPQQPMDISLYVEKPNGTWEWVVDYHVFGEGQDNHYLFYTGGYFGQVPHNNLSYTVRLEMRDPTTSAVVDEDEEFAVHP